MIYVRIGFSLEIKLFGHGADALRHELGDVATLADELPYLRAAHVVQRRLDQPDVRRKRAGIDGGAAAGIDDDLVPSHDVLTAVPAVEHRPVVGTDEEHELAVGEVAREGRERVPGVGGAGQMELEVARHKSFLALDGTPGHVEPLLVGQQVGHLLERVLG